MRWFVPALVLSYNSRRETGAEFSCRDENPLWHAWREALRAMLLLASEKDLKQTQDGKLHGWMNDFANKHPVVSLLLTASALYTAAKIYFTTYVVTTAFEMGNQ